ncbi:PAS domain S-box protein [Nitrospira sp. Nam80]
MADLQKANTEIQDARRAALNLMEHALTARQEAETLNDVARTLAGELDLQQLIQATTDAGTKLSGAKFGAFFYNVINRQGESYMLYALSGAPREAFEKFGLPRNTPVFEPTFRGTGVVRSDDITQDPRYGRMAPHHGQPEGHLPVRSYLAVPVVSRSGEVLGGLFFGHPEAGVFTEHAERMTLGIAAAAAVAIDNARLFNAAQNEVAERKQAEEALRHRSAQYETLLNKAPLGVYVVDGDFRIRDVNPVALPVFGNIPDLIGRDFDEVIHVLWTKEYADEIVRIFRHTLETGESYEMPEQSGFRVDRRIMEYYEWRIDRIELPDGRYGVVCYFRDISERVLARVKIAQSEVRYRSIVDQSVGGIAETDPTGRFITVNNRYCQLTGYTRQELMSMRMQQITHPEDLPRNVVLFEKLAVGGPPFDIEKRYVRKDGRVIWAHNSVSAIRDASGHVHSLIAVSIDITERKHAEAALHRNSVRQQILSDALVHLLATDDVQTIVRELFPRVAAHLGVDTYFNYMVNDQGDALDLHSYSGVSEEIAHQIQRLEFGQAICGTVAKTRRAIVATDIQHSAYDKAALVRSFGIQAYACNPLMSGERLLGTLSFASRTRTAFDERELEFLQLISNYVAVAMERVATLRAMRQLNEGLERNVIERTRELTESQERLRALATELNLTEQRERQRMATELHDYLAQLLVLAKIKIGQVKRLAEAVPACADLMLQTEQVLAEALSYTRTLVADLSPPVLHQFGLPVGLRWLAERMEQQGLTVSVHTNTNEVNIAENQAVLLFQSVRELLMNVVKHAKASEASVVLSQANSQLTIAVCDRGAGFNVSTADSTPLSSQFGLFSIRERMKALGGRFDIESIPGKGTQARLSLPLVPERNEEPPDGAYVEPALTPVVAAPAISPHDGTHPIRVLIVDDHAMMRQGLKATLTGYDHLEVIGEAANGFEAIERARVLKPDVIVMDVNMPKLDGLEATKRIKSVQPDIAILGLSLHHSDDVVRRMKEAGATAYVTKESAVDELCKAVEEAAAARIRMLNR